MSGVKIGQKGQGRSPRLPEKFSTLSKDFFHWEHVKIIMIQ